MADSDFICVYRQFFEEFAKVVEPNDPLPIRVASYNLSLDELPGEIIESCMQYLTEKSCPKCLLVPLTKIVMEEIQREAKKQPQHVYQPLKVMQTVTRKINEVCLRYIDNEKLSSLPSPVQETCISTHAIKHTRRKMEDRLICLPRFNTLYNVKSNTEAGYYAVFDGHNGSDAAAFAVSHLHQFLAESKNYPDDPVRAFEDAYAKTESRYKSKELKSGTTAVAILHQPAEKKLIVSWLGDSQAMLVGQGFSEMLVNPHKPERPDECKRIEELGGFVVNMDGLYRINGQLAVSRAIGDQQYKPIVSAEPEVRVVNLTGAEDFFVIGCDGLWDVVDPKDVVETVYFQVNEKPDHIELVSRRLVDLAKENHSTDNISVIVVFLTEPSEIVKRQVGASGLWPKNSSQNGVIMDFQQAEKDFFSKPFVDPGLNGNVYETNGTHTSNFNDQNKDDSDDDIGPETDVDAVDDVLVSPTKNKNLFENDCYQKQGTDDGKMSKLIEFSNDDTLPLTDDMLNFSKEHSGVDGAHSNDKYSMDSNPFNPFGKGSENVMETSDKYNEEVKLNKEEVDNFVNSNLIDHSNEKCIFDGGSENRFDPKDPFNVGKDESNEKNNSDFNRSADLFECDNNSFVNSNNAEESKMADIGLNDTFDVHKEVKPESNVANEYNPIRNNILDTMDNFTFQTNEPQMVFEPSEDVPLDASGYPPVLCSVIDVIEAQRMHLKAEDISLIDPETETPEVLSPSAPLLDGEPNEDAVVAESGGEGEESDDDDDDEWNYFKGQSGVAVSDKPTDLVINPDDSAELNNQAMNSPLNPDAAEFVPVSPPGGILTEADTKRTPLKNIRKDLNDIIAASPDWNTMEHVKVPEEDSFLKEVKSRPSNIFAENDKQPKELIPQYENVDLNPAQLDVSKESVDEPRGIDLATDMTSSFIDHSTMSAQSEISKQELEFIIQQNEQPPVIPENKDAILDVNAPEFNPVNDSIELPSRVPDLLSPLSAQEEETPKSTVVEAPSSPVLEEAPQSIPVESQNLDPSPTTQTPPSTPLSNEEVVSRPEELTEAFEKLTVGDNPTQAVAAAAVGLATAAAAVAIVADKKEETKKPAAKTATKTAAKPAPKTPSAAARTTAARKPATAPTTTTTRTKPATTTATAAPKTTASRVTSAAKPTETKPSAPKPKPLTTTPSAPKAAPRPRPTTATSPTKPTTPSPRSSTLTKATVSSATRTTLTKTTSTTASTPRATTVTTSTPKPRVPSAPVDKKPLTNGTAKTTITRKPAATTTTTTTTTRTTLASRPASAPAKPAVSKTTTSVTARTATSTAKPRTITSTTTATSRVTASATARKTTTSTTVTKEVASKVASKAAVPKTNGVANGRITAIKKPATTTPPSKTKIENKTESKADDQSVDIVQSENEKPIENNKDANNLINGIGSE